MSFSFSLFGCGDPVRDKLKDALPSEDPNVPKGPTHRPGQPCLVCHSPYGGAADFSIAGTLFAPGTMAAAPFVLPGYTVRIIDDAGELRQIGSNLCGNFFIRRSDWDPAFPLRVELYGPSAADATKLEQKTVMASPIGRDGSCAGCHIGAPSPFSPGVVTVPNLPATIAPPAAGECPDPWLGPDPRIPSPN